MFGEDDIKNSPFLTYGYNYINGKTSRIDFVNKWLKAFNIADELKVTELKIENKSINQTIGFYYSLVKNSIEIPLHDNGLGVNQLLLLMLKIASTENEKEFLLEEPETNLHPALQSKLAEMFVDAYNRFNSNFIIETHSEYLIRKLQTLIANKRISSKDVSIYYLYDPNDIPKGEKQVYKLDIRDDGFMNNDFGKGFFDEASSLSLDLLNMKNLN